MGHGQAFGEIEGALKMPAGGEGNVMDLVAFFADEMAVFLKVGTKAGGFAFDIDLTGQAAGNERLQAVVHRGQGDVWHLLLGPQKNFRGRRMVAFGQQHIIDFAALGSQTMTAVADRLFVA